MLSYVKGLADGEQMMRESVQSELGELGLVVPRPEAGPEATPAGDADEADDED